MVCPLLILLFCFDLHCNILTATNHTAFINTGQSYTRNIHFFLNWVHENVFALYHGTEKNGYIIVTENKTQHLKIYSL